MLVLGIKTGEKITFNDDIIIKFIKVKDHTIRVSIDAPKNVVILRDGVINKEI
ncbi:carbon storage regulator [Clostridium sp.]|uniref:carbon storage regulator n=1 Tax=Clostridium sp. TaxID=1506 RepID=UPI0025BD1BAA|nr:carbon storage regulator [Clostridium sp.]